LAKKGGQSSFFHVIFKMMSRRMVKIQSARVVNIRSAPTASAPKQALMGQKSGKLAKKSLLFSPYEQSGINSRFGGGCADHP
jgi:hypothetical protein